MLELLEFHKQMILVICVKRFYPFCFLPPCGEIVLYP